MRRLVAKKERLELKDGFTAIFEKTVTKFGTGAKIDCPKQFLNKKAYVIIRK